MYYEYDCGGAEEACKRAVEYWLSVGGRVHAAVR
jgi:hypothetical protein